MRIIAGVEKFEGERSGWHNVRESFYAQHQLESLNVENTMLEEMLMSGTGKTELELRQLLGCFLFSGDDVFKKIKVLSGGEKARVALAKVIASKANFLMLDEPTNHLDMQSVDLLIEALNKYEGTCMIISHDRYFVSRIAQKYWTIDDHQVNMFNGNYDEWLEWNTKKIEAQKANQEHAKIAQKQAKENSPVVSQKRESELKQLQKNANQIQKKIERDKKVNFMKTKEQAIEEKMADPEIFQNSIALKQHQESYQQKINQIQEKDQIIETLLEQLMELEDKML